MGKNNHDVRDLIHRAFAVFLTVFFISDVGRVYASGNLEIIAQRGESSQSDVIRTEANKLTREGTQLFKQGTKESLIAARKKFEAALVLWQKLDDKQFQAIILNNIAGIYNSLGQKQKALRFSKQALPLYRLSGDRNGEANTLWNIALLERKKGNLQASLNHIKNAIAIIEELRGSYTNQDLKTTTSPQSKATTNSTSTF